jgi:CheY-like chemotaxis protein
MEYPRSPAKEGRAMPKTVLIIEDDEDTRTIYTEGLQDAGYRVIGARNGAEGVHLARTSRPQLILLDIRMPVMDGLDALRYLRSLRETERIPICGISAHSLSEEEQSRAGAMSFDCFLMKPIDPRDVVAEVLSQIGPPEQGPSAVEPPQAD